MISFQYDQQEYHHAAVGRGISRLALTTSSTVTPISSSTTATKRVRKLVWVHKCVCIWVYKRVCVQVLLHVSGSGMERILSFVGAVASHVPHTTTEKAAPLTQPCSPFFL